MTAWVVRAGAHGEAEQPNLDQGVATVGWSDIGDLAPLASREQVRALVDETYPSNTPSKRANCTGQLWAFSHSIRPGDLVITPLKTKPGYLAFGRCTGDYTYAASEPDPDRRHQLPIDWAVEHLSRSALKDDLLNMVNGGLTVFSPSRNNAAARLQAVFDHGVDPGSNGVKTPKSSILKTATVDTDAPDDVYNAKTAPTADAIRDRILTHLVENVSKHKLTHLVAAILGALGFVCDVSPEGPDGGVDIIAGKGPLGLDSPTLIVEVKSEPGAVGVQVVRSLHSALNQHQADQGLLVAYGGVNAAARKEFAQQRTKIRIWDAHLLLENLFRTYDQLPETIQSQIPLVQTWVLESDYSA